MTASIMPEMRVIWPIYEHCQRLLRIGVIHCQNVQASCDECRPETKQINVANWLFATLRQDPNASQSLEGLGLSLCRGGSYR